MAGVGKGAPAARWIVRAGVAALFAAVAGCGGGGGGDEVAAAPSSVVPPAPPAASQPEGAAPAASQPEVPAPAASQPEVPAPAASQPDAPSPPAPAVARQWVHLGGFNGDTLVDGPSVQADGGLAAVLHHRKNGVVVRLAGAPDARWKLTHQLAVTPDATSVVRSFSGFAHDAGRFAAAGARFEWNSLSSSLVVAASTPDAPDALAEDGSLGVTSHTVRAHWNPDGSLSVLWVSTGGGPLNLRRWVPGAGWGPVVDVDFSGPIENLEITRLSDGRGLVTYGAGWTGWIGEGMVMPLGPVRVLQLDASGGVTGAPVSLDPDARGIPSSVKVTAAGAQVLVSWRAENADGSLCLASRAWRDGAWGARSCTPSVNSVWDSFSPWLVVAGRSGLAMNVWYDGQMRAAVRQPDGTWGARQPLGAFTAGPSAYPALAAVACPSGAAFAVWSTMVSTGSTWEMALYGRLRNPAGRWGLPMEVARVGSQSPDFLQAVADDQCNITVAWAQRTGNLYSSHDLRARRLLAAGTLEEPVFLARDVIIPSITVEGRTSFTGYLKVGIDKAGRGAAMWEDARTSLTHLSLYE